MALAFKTLASAIRSDYITNINKTKLSEEVQVSVYNSETNSYDIITLPKLNIPDPAPNNVWVDTFKTAFDSYAMNTIFAENGTPCLAAPITLVSNPSALTFSNTGNSATTAKNIATAIAAWWASQITIGLPNYEASVTLVVPNFPDLATNIELALLSMAAQSNAGLPESDSFERFSEILDEEIKKIEFTITEVTPTPPKTTVYIVKPT